LASARSGYTFSYQWRLEYLDTTAQPGVRDRLGPTVLECEYPQPLCLVNEKQALLFIVSYNAHYALTSLYVHVPKYHSIGGPPTDYIIVHQRTKLPL